MEIGVMIFLKINDPVKAGKELMVVGDSKQGCTMLFNTSEKKIKNPCLVSRIKIACRFIGKNNLWKGEQ